MVFGALVSFGIVVCFDSNGSQLDVFKNNPIGRETEAMTVMTDTLAIDAVMQALIATRSCRCHAWVCDDN